MRSSVRCDAGAAREGLSDWEEGWEERRVEAGGGEKGRTGEGKKRMEEGSQISRDSGWDDFEWIGR